jgi:hypothetical protein
MNKQLSPTTTLIVIVIAVVAIGGVYLFLFSRPNQGNAPKAPAGWDPSKYKDAAPATYGPGTTGKTGAKMKTDAGKGKASPPGPANAAK